MGNFAEIPSVFCICRDTAERDCYVEYGRALVWQVWTSLDCDEATDELEIRTFDVLVIAGMVQNTLGATLLERIRNKPGPNQITPAILVVDHKNISEAAALGRRDHINIEHIEFGQMLMSSFRIIITGIIAGKIKESGSADRPAL
ncbi:hypothetical protein E3C22_24175 [Jiella endophytica]|uniref:Response regulator transcription factor n=1 Tax=Jiella endophytica TaxID=2558362 RepID=A0A4Y8R6K6_9HYPH|nr:hypothetical protein [Jiella endophytica]TFF17232.1 hypothetical protein E3C22_24175 [Jiella endophytica]